MKKRKKYDGIYFIELSPYLFINYYNLLLLVGEPIHPPAKVSEEEKDQVVRELHEKYMQNLKDLYDKYKDKYAPDRLKEIEFVE